MFARNMTLKLQPNRLMRFIETYNATALPILKKQKIQRRSGYCFAAG